MELEKHYNHNIEIARYGDFAYAIECVDCYEVITDDEAYAMLERKD